MKYCYKLLEVDNFGNFVVFFTILSMVLLSVKIGFSIAILLFILFVIKNIDIYKKLDFGLDSISKGILLFYLGLFISAVGTMNWGNIKTVLAMFYLTLPYFMFCTISKVAYVQKGIFYGLYFVLLLGFLDTSYDFFINGIVRPAGLLRNPNNWASCLGLILPFFVYYTYHFRSIRERLIGFSACSLCLISLSYLRCRGMNLALICCLFFLFVYYLQMRSKALGVGVCLFVFFVVFFFYKDAYAFISRGYDVERMCAYSASLKMWMDYPAFGVGFNEWEYFYNNLYFPKEAKEYLLHAHNLFLQILSSSGLIGFLGFVCFVVVFLINGISDIINKNDLYKMVGICGLGIFLMHGMVDSTFTIKYVARFFWSMIFIYKYDINITSFNR